MPTKFYVASSLSNAHNATMLVNAMEAELGWECTYRWFDIGKVEPKDWAEVALKEKKGVDDCDVLVLLLPGKFGAHTELGLALGQGKKVFVCSMDGEHFEDGPITGTYPSIFYFLPEVNRISFESVFDLPTTIAALLNGAILQ